MGSLGPLQQTRFWFDTRSEKYEGQGRVKISRNVRDLAGMAEILREEKNDLRIVGSRLHLCG